MCFAGKSGHNAGISRPDLYVSVRLCNQHSDGVNGAVGKEDREAGEPRDKADRGQAHRYAHEVLLGDAHLQKPIRMRFGEFVRFGRVGQVRIQNEEVRISFTQSDQRVSPDVAHCFHTAASSLMPSSSAIIFNSSLVATLECHSCLPSVKCTPLPFTVCARIMVG